MFAPGAPTSTQGSLSVRGGGYGSIGGRLSVQDGGDHWGVRTGLESTRRDGDFAFIDHNGNSRIRNHNGSLDWSWTGAVYGKDLAGHNIRFNTWIHESIRQMPGAEQFPTPDALMTQARQLGSLTWNLPLFLWASRKPMSGVTDERRSTSVLLPFSAARFAMKWKPSPTEAVSTSDGFPRPG